VSVEFLAGLPTSSVLQRLSALGADDVVFTFGYFQDGDGRPFNPRDAAAVMAMAATAPMYGPLDTFIGTGVVGGRMPSFEDMGRQAAHIVNELLAGVAPSSLTLPSATPTALRVDWRQVRRWNIDERLIPGDAVVSYREPTFWEAYRNVALIAIAVMLLQAALIAKLLIERRRRRLAELAVQKQRTELAHASRLGVAGELTASIAHEINQPLGAVQTSADAADLILRAGGERREDLLRIVDRIRRDNRRASDVIRRLRALLAKHEPERQRFDINAAAADVVTLLAPEARRRGVHVDFRPAMAETCVLGDYTQMQQVLINLMLNAMDAVVDVPDARRTVTLVVVRLPDTAELTVSDRGRGIPVDAMPRLFDSFFSTKDTGMGLGLGIARTIIETHGGRIWAEHGPDGEGAVLRVELPIEHATEPAAVAGP
jgi:signal transduction histidine kinase